MNYPSVLKEFYELESGFLLNFRIKDKPFLTSSVILNENFKRCKIRYNGNNVKLETPSNYIFPCFPENIYNTRFIKRVFDIEAISTILASLYFYKLLAFNFECTIKFKNRYDNTPTKIDLLRNHIPEEFTKIMKDAGHEINYGILLNTLNSFNPDNHMSCRDFLFNLKT